jgi:hypothetical protein
MDSRKVWRNAKVDAVDGDLDGLTQNFRNFLEKTYRELFYTSMCFLWLEKQVVFNGRRRIRRFRSGDSHDKLYGYYMADMVGHDQATLTRSRWFQISAAVSWEVCPEFFQHNPFEEPEYYQWPFEHAGLDFLSFVYQVDNRLELLEYADKMKMPFLVFKNWATNYVLCYNDAQGEVIYNIGKNREGVTHIQKVGWDPFRHSDQLAALLKHESKKT